MNNILHLSLVQIAKISLLLNPIIPKASSKVLDALSMSTKSRNLSFLDETNLLSDEIEIKDLRICHSAGRRRSRELVLLLELGALVLPDHE